MQFRSLRVMNEDVVAPGQGFGTHPHRDMEIVTYVLEGAIEHRDSMDNGEVLRPGEFQRMSAGTGITLSEFNPSDSEPVQLYQIWLLPERIGIEPSISTSSDWVADSLAFVDVCQIDASVLMDQQRPGRRVARSDQSKAVVSLF